MKKINIALVGFGVIGSGVVEILQNNKELIKKRTGIELELKYVVDKDWERPRNIEIKYAKKIDDYNIALKDNEIDIIIELVGGTGFAFKLVEESIKANKHVVTANKALLAEKGNYLFRLAKEHNRLIYFEASVCGGIPIIRTITDALCSDNIKSIYGIVNGTTNYILTKMYEEKMGFQRALKEAQKLGFAEADPTLDINGNDAAHKIAILASLAFNTEINFEQIYFEGIENIELEDIKDSDELGYIIKLLAIAKLDPDNKLEVRVHPCLIKKNNPLAYIRNEFNAVLIDSEYLTNSMYTGRGAGSRPTATAVIADIIDIAKFIDSEIKPGKHCAFNNYEIKFIGNISSRYYLRFHVLDKPGVLHKLTGIFSKFNISIASLIQKERSKTDFVPLIATTHFAYENDIIMALDEIEKMDFIKDRPRMIRILE